MNKHEAQKEIEKLDRFKSTHPLKFFCDNWFKTLEATRVLTREETICECMKALENYHTRLNNQWQAGMNADQIAHLNAVLLCVTKLDLLKLTKPTNE